MLLTFRRILILLALLEQSLDLFVAAELPPSWQTVGRQQKVRARRARARRARRRPTYLPCMPRRRRGPHLPTYPPRLPFKWAYLL